MKLNLTLPLILAVAMLSNCNKSEDIVTHINCDGLITDTLGTGDNAKIFMPNAFTPNGDGRNEMIRPVLVNITSFIFTIYDGNNNIVFTSSAPSQGWSTSTSLNNFETYYYKIQATTNNNHQIGMCGELYKLSCMPVNAPVMYFEDQLTAAGFTATSGEMLPNCP